MQTEIKSCIQGAYFFHEILFLEIQNLRPQIYFIFCTLSSENYEITECK